MCGIAGTFAYRASAPRVDVEALHRCRDAMLSRGPDGTRTWLDTEQRIGFTHLRLAIIDLHDRASQPMHAPDYGLTIVFNGEIYNYAELRAEIAASGRFAFATTSDTEVLLALYTLHGAAMVDRLRGMFAFAIHDSIRNELFLARDPYGIKPLYYSDQGGTLRFASSVKALIAGGEISREADPAGIVGFHLFGAVPEPFTLYRAISALPAGHTILIDSSGVQQPVRFASIVERLAGAQRDDATPVEQVVREAVLDSVRAHMVADVEVGTFLSSGTDSGSLLGLMRDAGASRIRAITMGFEELTGGPSDEVPIAREVARHYGAEHHVRVVGREEFVRSLPEILAAMDQPSVDGINTWMVSRVAHECGLKVVLSGLGGDELLAGYSTFRSVPGMKRTMGAIGALPLPSALARSIVTALAPGWARRNPKALGVLDYGSSWAGAYLLRRAVLLPFELDRTLDEETRREGLERLAPIERIAASLSPDPGNDVSRVTALESSNYMRNQLLRDSDWASMAHSLELRTPLVDWELLRRIAPVSARLGEGVGKRALANAPSSPLPRACLERARTGFTVPIGQWMKPRAAGPTRTDARDWSAEVARAFAA